MNLAIEFLYMSPIRLGKYSFPTFHHKWVIYYGIYIFSVSTDKIIWFFLGRESSIWFKTSHLPSFNYIISNGKNVLYIVSKIFFLAREIHTIKQMLLLLHLLMYWQWQLHHSGQLDKAMVIYHHLGDTLQFWKY